MSKTLAQWMKDEGLTQTQASVKLKIRHGTLSKYVNGKQIPRPPHMLLIWLGTDGQVDPNSFHNLPPLDDDGKPAEAAA